MKRASWLRGVMARLWPSLTAIITALSIVNPVCVGGVATPVVLDASNFSSTIATAPVVLVMFFDKKCGICVEFGPKYAVVARELPKV